jgi:hypothetical protein
MIKQHAHSALLVLPCWSTLEALGGLQPVALTGTKKDQEKLQRKKTTCNGHVSHRMILL